MKPSKTDLKSLLQTCERTSRNLASIEEELLRWAVHREKLLGAYNGYLRKKRLLAEKLPEDWHDMTASQVAAGMVLVHPNRIRKFLRNHRDMLKAEQAELLQHFTQEPWFFTAFMLKEVLEMDFFIVEDVETGSELLLHSPAVGNLYRRGARLYLTLFFHNGECYQTFGPLHYYRGFQPYDFEYFSRQLSPLFYGENGLSATIANTPAPFLLLDTGTEHPPIAHEDKIVQICCDEVTVEQFDPERYSGMLEVDTKEGIIRCRLRGEFNPFRTAAAFHDSSKRKLFVRATRIELYREIRSILAEDIRLPERPYWFASMNMYIAVREILDKDIPAAPYLELFEKDQTPVSPSHKEQLDTLNAFIKELNRRRNEGTPVTLDELAREYGVSADVARQAEEILRNATSRFELDIPGGLEGYRPPPPVDRQKFRAAPWENGVFVFLDSPRVEQLFRETVSRRDTGTGSEPPDSLEDVPRWLEELTFADKSQEDFTLLNISLHLLCNRGQVMEPVRDYAVEVLRLFWQVFVPDKEPASIEAFIGGFALFCYQVLFRGGLADIEPIVSQGAAKKAGFSLGPSAFFRAWAFPARDARR
jgi:hypothetical protein